MFLKYYYLLGEKQQMWLKQFKIALIEKNTENLSRLMDDIPSLSRPEDIEQALYLIKEASLLVQTLKDETVQTMGKMKKNIAFLKATEAPKLNNFDIKL